MVLKRGGGQGCQASKLEFARPSGLKRVGKDVKLVSLSWQDQVVCDRMELVG